MTTKRRKFVAIVLLAVIGGVISYSLLRQSDEPKYQGRRLSEWLAHWNPDDNEDSIDEAGAKVAVQNIGTNALPYLLKWIDYETPAWRATLYRALPAPILKRTTIVRWLEGEDSRHASRAWLGFLFLGTNAVSAVPALEALMKDTTKPESSLRAIFALSGIGEPAIPVLKAGLANSKQSHRSDIVAVVGYIANARGTNACLPILIEALKDDDPQVRYATTNALEKLAPEALTNGTTK